MEGIKKEINVEVATRLKRIHWAHKPTLLWVTTKNELFMSYGIDYTRQEESFRTLFKFYVEIKSARPILRTLENLTEEEWNSMDDIFAGWKEQQTIMGRINLDDISISEPDDLEGLFIRLSVCPLLMDYLLSIGVDVYGLIPSSHAISEKEAKEKGWVK